MAPDSTREVPDREPYVQRDRHGRVVKPGSRERANREPADRGAQPRDRRSSGGRGRDTEGSAGRGG